MARPHWLSSLWWHPTPSSEPPARAPAAALAGALLRARRRAAVDGLACAHGTEPPIRNDLSVCRYKYTLYRELSTTTVSEQLAAVDVTGSLNYETSGATQLATFSVGTGLVPGRYSVSRGQDAGRGASSGHCAVLASAGTCQACSLWGCTPCHRCWACNCLIFNSTRTTQILVEAFNTALDASEQAATAMTDSRSGLAALGVPSECSIRGKRLRDGRERGCHAAAPRTAQPNRPAAAFVCCSRAPQRAPGQLGRHSGQPADCQVSTFPLVLEHPWRWHGLGLRLLEGNCWRLTHAAHPCASPIAPRSFDVPATDCGLRYYWALYEADQQKYAVVDGNGEHAISGALAEHGAQMAGGPVRVDTASINLVTPTPGSTRRTFQLKDVPDGETCPAFIRAVWVRSSRCFVRQLP